MTEKKDKGPSICVFCGSSPGNDPRYIKLATDVGTLIAEHGHRLVYGGGGLGLMGASARAAHENGGDVLGIIPSFLLETERAYTEVEHRIVPDMHERKMQMFEESEAFIILPGGIGTLEEAVEIMSWMRLCLHQKPIVFVSNDAYWEPMTSLLDHIIDAKFAPEWMREGIFEATTAQKAMAIIEDHWANPPEKRKLVIEPTQV